MCVVEVSIPSGKVEVLTKLTRAGVIKVVCPSGPVVVKTIIEDKVESGATVTKLMTVDGLGFKTVIVLVDCVVERLVVVVEVVVVVVVGVEEL